MSRTFPFWTKKQSARLIALSEYDVFLLERKYLPTPSGRRKKSAGIEVRHFALGRDFVSHGLPSPDAK